MRIDDNDDIIYNAPDNINIDHDIDDIESLIRDIEINENVLRRRTKRLEYIPHVLKNTIIDEIDDVDIKIDIPKEYYLNKDRRIMKYSECNIQYVLYVISMHIVNTLLYLINVSVTLLV
jgi:hypothetical protein